MLLQLNKPGVNSGNGNIQTNLQQFLKSQSHFSQKRLRQADRL